MSKTFLQVELTTGEQVISEFSKLGKIGRYVGQVFAGSKPLNVWSVLAKTHPHSGEPVLIRRRRFIPAAMIVAIEAVQPKAGMAESHDLNPANFEPVPQMQKGTYGLWVAPEDAAEGLVAGAEYPVHVDPESLQRYVIISGAGTPDERRWFFHSATWEPVAEAMPVGGGEGAAFDDDYNEDDD